MAERDLAQLVRSLSPGALALYKRQLASLPERDRQQAFSRLANIPELADITGRPTPVPAQKPVREQPEPQAIQQEVPLWAKGLQTIGAPFEWISEHITEPFGAVVTAPFTPELPGGRQPGESSLAYERRQYEQWEEPTWTMPWGYKFRPTKGIVETLPWLAVPGAAFGAVGGARIAGALGKLGKAGEIAGTLFEKGGLAAAEKLAARGGQLGAAARMAAKVVRPIAAVEALPGKIIGAGLGKIIPKKGIITERTGEFVALSNEALEKEILRPDWQRSVAQRLAKVPMFKGLLERLVGKASTVTGSAEDIVARATLVGIRVQEALNSKGEAILSTLREIHTDPLRLFNIDEATGLARNVKAKVAGVSTHIADIAEHPAQYALTLEQQKYIQQLHNIEDWVLNGLKTEGIDVKELKFDEFSHWVHRVVSGKTVDDALIEIRQGSSRKIGTKARWEKTRFYETAAEGVKAGIVYEPNLQKVVELYVQTAARRIADQRMASMIAPLGRSIEVFTLPKTINIVNAALRKAPVTAQQLATITRDMPEVGKKIADALQITDWSTRYSALQQIKKELATFIPTGKERLFFATEKLTAQRKGAEQAVLVIQRALRGEVVPTGTIKAIGKVFPEIKDQLREKTRFVLDDLIKAGEEAKKYPIELKPGSAMGMIKQYEEALLKAQEALAADPKNAVLFREVKKLRTKVAFTKHRIAVGEPIQFEKAPVGILTAERKEALTEMLDKIRGTPYEVKTATGKVTTKYSGGAVKELRAKELEALEARREVRERIARPRLGEEAVIAHPAFQGRIFPIAVRDEIQQYWDDVGFGALAKLATVSGGMRTLVAAADFSAAFIQGLPMMALHPKAWATGLSASFKSFATPKFYENYLGKHLASLTERAHYGGYVGGFEYMEAMPLLQRTVGGVSKAVTGQRKLGEAAVRQTYGRFEASFGSFGDVARNEMWSALKGRAKNPEELMEIARHIDRMTGVMSSKGLGIGKTQRDFEQAFLFFAPRYTRAGFALVGDLAKGGITGAETRKALGSLMAGGATLYWGTAKALGQEPNFDPTNARFMTIEITDPLTGTTKHFGIGGMMTSLARFGADVTASAIGAGQNEPLDFVKLNRFDNPFIKFMFSKSAPLTGFMTGLLSGENYFGEPFENAGDYALFVGEQVMPIAFQSALTEEGGFAPTALAAEELGLRTFPRSDWEKRDIIRDRLSQESFGVSWEDLGRTHGKLEQEKLEKGSPELKQATEQAAETSSKMARGEGLVWLRWKRENEDIEEFYRSQIKQASAEFEATKNGRVFNDKVNAISKSRRDMHSRLKNDPAYSEIYEYFDEPLEPRVLSRMNPKDLARREYYQQMYSSDMFDQFGNYLFDKAEQKERRFAQEYGQEVLDYIEEYRGAKWEEPMAFKVLKEAKELLRPYWDIADKVWAMYPKGLQEISDQIQVMENGTDEEQRLAKIQLRKYPMILRARELIARFKKTMRERNPAINQAHQIFY